MDNKSAFKVHDLEMYIEEVVPGYDKNKKHVQTMVRLRANGDKITIYCFNTTQRVKVERKGYLEFASKFLLPLFCQRISQVGAGPIDKYNKKVINAMSDKRKAVSRPMRSFFCK